MNPTAPNDQPPFANTTPQVQTPVLTPAPPVAEQPQVLEVPTATSSNNKKIFIGLLGIFVLLAGVITGVILLRHNQNPQKKAANCSDWCTSPQECAAANGVVTNPCSFEFCEGNFVACSLDSEEGTSDDGQCSVTFPGGVTGKIVISESCGLIDFDVYYRPASPGTTDGDCVGTHENRLGKVSLGPGAHNPRNYGPGGCGYCVQLDSNQGGSAQYTGDCPTPTPVSSPTSSPKSSPSPTATATPVATPTMPPDVDITAMCIDVRAYDNEWNSLTADDLALLQPGDLVRFGVRGSASDNGITKARFSLNGSVPVETTLKKPDSDNEYYQEFILPEFPEDEDSLTISVKAELYHPDLNMWF